MTDPDKTAHAGAAAPHAAEASAADIFRQAAQAHQAGKLPEAEAGYRYLLAQDRRHADALYLLGVIRQQQGQRQNAETLYRAALDVREDARFLFSLAGVLHDGARLAEAEAAFRRTLELAPQHADAHNNYGILLSQAGRVEEAEKAYRCAIAARPDFVVAHNNLARLLKAANRLPEAEAILGAALEMQPASADSYLNLGAVLAMNGKAAEAEQAYLQALTLQPQSAAAHNNLAILYYQSGRFAEAEAACRQALTLQPDFPLALNNLGNLHKEAGRLQEAMTAYRAAIALDPLYADAYNNLGSAHKEGGDFDAALACTQHALEIAPDNADARVNHAYLLLHKGDFTSGWRDFEFRWKIGGNIRPRIFSQPLCTGDTDLAGKTIFLHAEQGFGDTLQFMRYAALAAERGARVILGVPTELSRLAGRCAGVAQVVSSGDAVPEFDCHSPLMSLPLALNTELHTVPAQVPYVTPDPAAVAQWRAMLGAKRVPRVGLVWAGSPRRDLPAAYAVDRQRSFDFARLAPLLDLPGVDFYSLQLGTDAAAQLHGHPTVIDLTAQLRDFHDTAALVENLDLVISVDTAMAHLTGAIGKPVWMLNRYNSCWRWLAERSDSPWYPTMRIFRQARPGQWDDVIATVRAALLQHLGSL